ncbi:MAG: hypothetical protein ACXW04_09340 [Methylobacter sp.]
MAFKNSRHSSRDTAPFGLAVPKYSESWMVNCSLLLQVNSRVAAQALRVIANPTTRAFRNCGTEISGTVAANLRLTGPGPES